MTHPLRITTAAILATALAFVGGIITPAQAQSTRSSLNSYANSTFTSNGHGNITGPELDAGILSIIASAANVADTNTYTGLNTFGGGLDVYMPTLTPSSSWGASTLGIYANETVTGTRCSSGGNCFYNLFDIVADDIPGSANNYGWFFSHNIGGSSMTGNRAAANFSLVLNATTGNTSVGGDYSAATFEGTANANDNGTSGSAAGQVSTINVISTLGASATYYRTLQGMEIDLIDAGSSNEKEGLGIVQLPGDTSTGTVSDGAIAIDNYGGTPGWAYGIAFGGFGGEWPMQSTGTVIGCVPTYCGTAASILDFSGATVTGYDLKLPSFTVTGAGSVVAGAGITSESTTAAAGFFSYGASGACASINLGITPATPTIEWSLACTPSNNFIIADVQNSNAQAFVILHGGNTTIGETSTNTNTINGVVQHTGLAIASLPTCNSSNPRMEAWINNGIAAPTYRQAVSATGSAIEPVYCIYNGSTYGWAY